MYPSSSFKVPSPMHRFSGGKQGLPLEIPWGIGKPIPHWISRTTLEFQTYSDFPGGIGIPMAHVTLEFRTLFGIPMGVNQGINFAKKNYSVQVWGKGHVWDADEDFAVGAPFLSVPGCRLWVSAPFGARLVFLKSFTVLRFNSIP